MSSVFTSKSRPGQCCEHQTDMHYVLARALMSEATVNQKSDTLKLNRLLSKLKVALPVISLRSTIVLCRAPMANSFTIELRRFPMASFLLLPHLSSTNYLCVIPPRSDLPPWLFGVVVALPLY
ncbi:hypothetical protein Bca101_019984 [Brassica carinata]